MDRLKKVIILHILYVGLLLSGCTPEEKVMKNYSAPEFMEESRGNTFEKKVFEKTSVIGGNAFSDPNCGFELSFPENWKEWYTVKCFEDGSVTVYFMGKSSTAQGIYANSGIYGLPMFSILKEKKMQEENNLGTLDSIEEIGSIQGEKYYYATGTDAPGGVLFDVLEQIVSVDDIEYALVRQDWEKLQQMQAETDLVLQSFRAV